MGSVVVVIPARYESTRLPGKPLADLHGKPMIRRVYERAASAPESTAFWSPPTTSASATRCAAFGGEAVMTSRGHTTGTDRIAEVAAELDAGDRSSTCRGTCRCSIPQMVTAAIAPLRGRRGAADVHDQDAHPLARGADEPERRQGGHRSRRLRPLLLSQPAALLARRRARGVLAHKHIGLYAYRRDFLLSFARLAPTPLEQAEKLEQLRALEWGFRIKVAEIAAASIEVDTRTGSGAGSCRDRRRLMGPALCASGSGGRRESGGRTRTRKGGADGGRQQSNQVHLRHRRRGLVSRQGAGVGVHRRSAGEPRPQGDHPQDGSRTSTSIRAP